MEILQQHLTELPRGPEFGNGRLVRNIFEAAVARQSSRIVANGETDLTSLVLSDLSLAPPTADPQPPSAPTGQYL